MLRVLMMAMLVVWTTRGAERKFEFTPTKANEILPGFRSTVTGDGKPGTWRVANEPIPASLPTLYSNSPAAAQMGVLSQTAQDPAEEHFPLLVFDDETFADFTFTARVKAVSGHVAQMAGLAFRIQDEKNYYVVRISATGTNVQFYKFVGGVRTMPIGPSLPVACGTWHELGVDCRGNQITVFFDGKPAMPVLTDSSFAAGKVGFWTKSDSVSSFADARISYTPREKLVNALVKEALHHYDRLRGLKVYALPANGSQARVIGSNNAADLGQTGGKEELTCLKEGTPYIGKTSDHVVVMLPLRDRNGDIVAAVKVYMNTFFGQTDANALVRARPVVRLMESRVVASQERLE
jgi:hypothetical protein